MDLVILGWRPGVKAISLIGAIRKYKHIGLKEAKQEIDELLSGKSIHLHGLEAGDVETARREFEALGCICSSTFKIDN